VNGHRPSVDVLFQSVAQEFGSTAMAVLMTGMGDDGAIGMGAVQAVRGTTIAQSPDTCVVDSMPRAAIARGFVTRIVSLSGMASILESHCRLERLAAGPADAASPGEAAPMEKASRRR
jgi:two-component system chemotaxis response regulator CheB